MRPEKLIIHQTEFPPFNEFYHFVLAVVPTLQEIIDYTGSKKHLIDDLYNAYESAHMWRSLYATPDGDIDLLDSVTEFVDCFLYESDLIQDFVFNTQTWSICKR